MSNGNSWARSRSQHMVAGVCGGLAKRLGWKVSTVRVIWLIGTVIPVLPGLPVYLLLWLLLPYEDQVDLSQ